MIVINLIVHGESIVWMNEITDKVTVHGLKLEIGNWGEQYKSMKAKFLISMFRERLPDKNTLLYK